MVRHTYIQKKAYIICIFFWVGIFSKHGFASRNSSLDDFLENNFAKLANNFEISANNLTISQNKRTKNARQNDEIHKNDIRLQDVKQAVLSEIYSDETNINNKQNEFGKYRNYNKYAKHDHNNPKYRKKYKKTQGRYECTEKKQRKYQCTAFLFATTYDPSVVLMQSLNGSALTLASPYEPQGVTGKIFSNKARGSYSPDNDLGVSYVYFNISSLSYTLARFRHDGAQANLVYETNTIAIASLSTFGEAFVTDMSMAKGILSADAYNLGYVVNTDFVYQQYNVNSKSGALISTISAQTMCTDIFFFDDKCSRWLCFGKNPEDTAYLRDPSTDTNYIPPKDNNPVADIHVETFRVFWATAARLCGSQYMSLIGIKNPASTGDVVEVQFIRAKVSLKYPFFEKIETFYTPQREFANGMYIYSPPDTDIVYACFRDTFWRFDGAYTGPIPVHPTVEMSPVPWDTCFGIVSFKECPNEVYVRGYSSVWYSKDGGRSFTQVDDSGLLLFLSQEITGLAIPN